MAIVRTSASVVRLSAIGRVSHESDDVCFQEAEQLISTSDMGAKLPSTSRRAQVGHGRGAFGSSPPWWILVELAIAGDVDAGHRRSNVLSKPAGTIIPLQRSPN
jgi:hypothetical protein